MQQLNRSFSSYYFQALTSPSKAFNSLLADNRCLRFGTIAVMINAVIYTLVYIFLYLGGGQPYKPWLAIPGDVYYSYNIFFLAPSMFASWILAAGVVQLLSRLFYGKGSFENTAGVMGFGITIASLATSIHDLVSSFLGAIKVIDQHEFEVALNSPTIWRAILWVLMLAYLVWFIVLFTKGIKIAQKVKTGEALLLGTMGFIVYQVLFFVFNR